MASFSIGEIAPREERRTRIFKLLGHPSEITFYPNRITLEPSGETSVDHDDTGDSADEASDLNQAARDICRLVATWDWTGPVVDGGGRTVVEHDAPVPIEPDVVQCIPTRLIRSLNDAIAEDVFPKTRDERRSRRR